MNGVSSSSASTYILLTLSSMLEIVSSSSPPLSLDFSRSPSLEALSSPSPETKTSSHSLSSEHLSSLSKVSTPEPQLSPTSYLKIESIPTVETSLITTLSIVSSHTLTSPLIFKGKINNV